MIKTFAQSWLEDFWHDGKHKKVPAVLTERLLRKLDMLNRSDDLQDLMAPPANRLHSLSGNRQGQYAISVNGPWRLCFHFLDGDIYDLELVQYH
jgi:toxin HigB-1